MTIRIASWPKLIGAFFVAVGCAVSLKAADLVSAIMETDSFAWDRPWPIVVAAVGCVGSIVVGLAAYSAREWARRTLIVLTVVSILLCAGHAYMGITRSISALGQLETKFVLWSRLLFVGEALGTVSPPVFFLLVLLHPDVVRSFRPRV